MESTKPNAIVYDLDREVTYPCRLAYIPRVGELMKLYSFLDQASNHPMPTPLGYRYKVVQVLHDVTDFDKSNELSMRDSHGITVYVRSSHDALFR